MSCRIKKIFKIIGISLLVILLLLAILVIWLHSLGSTDDFSIKDYKVYAFVDPMNHMLNIDCDLTLQALGKKDKVSFILGLAVNVDVKEIIDLSSKQHLSYNMNKLILPMIGEWPKLNILTVQLPKEVHPAEQTKIRLNYALNPREKSGRFFRGIIVTENEVDVSGKSASFPFLMFPFGDFLSMMKGNMGVFQYFPYELKVNIPNDWKATLYYGMGKVKAVEKLKERKVVHLSSEGGVALPIPAFQARKIIDVTIKENRLQDFEFMWKKIDEIYPFFDLKNIDWKAIYEEFKPQIASARDEMEHYDLLGTMLRKLHDGHAFIGKYRDSPARTRLDLAMTEIEGLATILNVKKDSEADRMGLKRGMIIQSLDGVPVSQKIEKLIPLMRASTQREARARAYSYLTLGKPGQRLSLVVTDEKEIKFKKSLTFPHKKDEDVEHQHVEGRLLPGGLGYMKIPSWQVREFSMEDFERVLDKLKDTRGMIIDLCGNAGGSGFSATKAAGRFLKRKTHFGSVAARKYKKDHTVFTDPIPMHVNPEGSWQYRNPLIILVNSLVASSSERFVMGLKNSGRAIVMGSRTAGSLSNNAPIWLPSGIRIYVSNQIDYSPGGEIVENNGIVPDIRVEQTIEDLRNGRDTVLEKAVEVLEQSILK